MAKAFKRRGEHVRGRLDEAERRLLRSLLGEVRTLVEGMGPLPEPTGDPLLDALASVSVDPVPSDDPAVRRLFPDAILDDPAASAEYRRLTEGGLRQARIARIDQVRGLLDDGSPALSDKDGVTLTVPQAAALAQALTDVRLVLGERLGLATDDDAERVHELALGDPSDPLAFTAAVYEFLTWLQETVTGALLR